MWETHSRRGEQIECVLFLKSLSHIHIYVAFKCTRGKKIVGCSGDVSFKGSSCLLKAWQLLCKCCILFSVLLLKKLLPCCTDRSNVPLSKFMFCLDKRFENEPWFMWLSYYTAPLRSPSSCWCYLENWESWFNNRHKFIFLKYMICKLLPLCNNFRVQVLTQLHNLQWNVNLVNYYGFKIKCITFDVIVMLLK